MAPNAWAGATPPPVRAEINALMGRLESSGCQFLRNGDWHSASEAKAHLLKKLEAIEGSTTVAKTEQFIELAATRSSMSGQAYQVRCGQAAPVPSATWLGAQLQSIRSSTASDGSSHR
ncbi:DUF5329 domain-containing protein [Ideonella sp. DXS29W]|uniref:DUF5329 domain-containing protein n=1 Tax=Ideonella lacteola TaxID=2984193 RepID=A0ABU9BJT7_9BURK